MSYRILILGGYGLFGGLLVKNFLQEKDLDVLIAGRNLEKAETYLVNLLLADINLDIACKLDAVQLDATSKTLTQELESLNIDLLIHTCGPYQNQNYHVAMACIDAGVHYIDLADGRDFVSNIDSLDHRARAKNCLVVSGASSVPGLSSCVAREYLPEFSEVDEWVSYILPGNQTPRGLATIRSILSYVGKPIRIWKNKQWLNVYGWQDLERVELEGLGSRWSGNCDVPDLSLFPQHYPQIKTVRFQAGLELSFLQLSTWLLSWFSRIGFVKNWSKYATPLKTMSEWFYSLGSNTGGMRVDITGKDKHSNARSITWQIIVLDGKGPYIPTISATLLAKKLIKGKCELRGAKPCMELFTLDEFKATINELGLDESVSYHCSTT